MKQPHQDIREQAVDCMASLSLAMQEAGGRIFTLEDMRKLSLLDFITTVAAQNNIRFKYVREKEVVGDR